MSLTEEVTFGKDGEIEDTGLLRKLFLSLVIILVASLSFGLGRLTGGERVGIKLEYDPQLTTNNSQPTNTASVINSNTNNPSNGINNGEVVGSSKGSKYHYAHCPGAKQISEGNKVVFATSEAAEASGYTLAANCKP